MEKDFSPLNLRYLVFHNMAEKNACGLAKAYGGSCSFFPVGGRGGGQIRIKHSFALNNLNS